jgi:uncharacterized protein (DUF488 family)
VTGSSEYADAAGPGDAGNAIYTVGHGDGSFGDLQRRLALHRVQMIVDVRSLPYSRHAPDFTRPELEEECAEAGLGYRWLGDRLGGLPDDPGLLTPQGRPDYDAIAASPGFAGGIEELLGLARTDRVALLCAESLPDACHRATLLAPELERRGCEVHHIHPDGTASRHQPSLGF